MSETERLLRYALVPVEPPGALSDRLEQRLTQIRGAAAEELGHLELRAMRNPRNWARPVAAAVIGGLAGGALVLVRARQRQRGRRDRRLRAVRGAADDLRGRLRG
jgi:hypothetical protein